MSKATLRVLLADDEALARQRLLRLLSGVPHVIVVGECTNGREVIEHLEGCERAPDVLLLDIRMPELSGLETRALLPDEGPYVIFTTAYSEHALEAFDVGADDYLLKPIEAGKLKRALERAAIRLASEGETRPVELNRIAVQTVKGVVLVDPNNLSHAQLDGELTTLHTSRGPVLADFSLQQLHDQLPDGLFWRVHRRALLNLDYIDHLQDVDSGGYQAHMMDGSAVTVSRQAGRRLRRQLGLSK